VAVSLVGKSGTTIYVLLLDSINLQIQNYTSYGSPESSFGLSMAWDNSGTYLLIASSTQVTQWYVQNGNMTQLNNAAPSNKITVIHLLV
jgi:hypothetical protein